MDDDGSVDALASKAVEISIVVQDLIEEQNSAALEEYRRFRTIALHALDLQLEKASAIENETKQTSKNVEDLKAQLKAKINEFEKISEEIPLCLDEIANNEAFLESARDQEDLSKIENENKKYQSQIETITMNNEDIIQKIVQTHQKHQIETSLTLDLETELKGLKKQLQEAESNHMRVLKKSKRKAIDLESRIRRSLSSSSLSNQQSPPNQKIQRSSSIIPSIIVHRTKDHSQDKVRELKAQLESAIQANVSLKSDIDNLRLDISAMKEENQSLKDILRLSE